MSAKSSAPKRPLSPHLQVYKLPMTAILSILHRATGAALAVGTILVAAFFIAAASGEDHYNFVMGLATSLIGQLVLFAWSAALYYHMCNGVRHLVADTGRLLTKKSSRAANFVVLIAAATLTVATWLCAINY